MKPHKTLLRKRARTAIYTAVYGPQEAAKRQDRLIGPTLNRVKRSNLPWLDSSRHRPQDWNTSNVLQTVYYHLEAAQLDDFRKRILAADLQVTSL